MEFAYKFKIQCEYTDQKLRDLLQQANDNDDGNEENQNHFYLQGLNEQKDSANVKLENIEENTEEDREIAEPEDQEREEFEDDENKNNAKTSIQEDPKGCDLIEIDGVTFEECSSYSSEEYNVGADEAAAEEAVLIEDDQSNNDEKKYIEIDFDENPIIEIVEKFQILDDIPEVIITKT